MHFVIALAWLVFAVFTGVNYFTGAKTITVGIYLFLTFWHLFVWCKGIELKKVTIFIAIISSMFWCLVLWGKFAEILPPHKIPGAHKIVQMANLLGTEFLITFLTAFILSPLLISIFRKNNLMSLIVFAPAFIVVTISNFNNIKRFYLSIGIISAEFLGIISAIQISALLLNRIIKANKSNAPSVESKSGISR